jgi:hypothetical protein
MSLPVEPAVEPDTLGLLLLLAGDAVPPLVSVPLLMSVPVLVGELPAPL